MKYYTVTSLWTASTDNDWHNIYTYPEYEIVYLPDGSIQLKIKEKEPEVKKLSLSPIKLKL